MTERSARRVGIDWGSETHQVCRIDEGEEPRERRFPHTGEGLKALVDFIVEGDIDRTRIVVAIETNQGPVVETLLAIGLRVYSINPKLQDRLRDRFSMAGAKDDRRDAFVLASCVDSDAHAFRQIVSESEEIGRLRGATRLLEELKEEFRANANRLWTELRDYRPEFLTLCPGADEEWFWAMLEKAPRPGEGARLTRARIGAVLKHHRIRRVTAQEIQAVLRRDVLSMRPAYIESHVARALVLVARLKLAQAQIADVEKQIQKALAERLEREEQSERRDLTILLSLPGVGPLTAATALAESGDAFDRRDYNALRSLCGAAPITKQSGSSRRVEMRRVCQPRLRASWHHAAFCAIQVDPKLRALYLRGRERGQSVGRALRNIVDRLLFLAVQLLRRNQLYDLSLRQTA